MKQVLLGLACDDVGVNGSDDNEELEVVAILSCTAHSIALYIGDDPASSRSSNCYLSKKSLLTNRASFTMTEPRCRLSPSLVDLHWSCVVLVVRKSDCSARFITLFRDRVLTITCS